MTAKLEPVDLPGGEPGPAVAGTNGARVIAVCLDGYEYSLAQRMMDAGSLPEMRALAARSARFALDHGPDLRTGLAGEHVATGLSAAAARRWAAVHFDPQRYAAWQQGTALPPFPEACDFRTVVLDPPYFDLAQAPNVRGFVNWGAHDPGVPPSARPAGLLDEIEQRFGAYPAPQWIYGTPWHSPARARAMGEQLTAGVHARARMASWLLRERLPDWDLALITVSEAHSAIEGLWHGVDAAHPLHGVPSTEAAGAGIHGVYAAIDDLIGTLEAEFPDARIVLFSMHGMGANESDAASMLLLGELMYRHAFGKPLYETPAFPTLPGGVPGLAESRNWRNAVCAGFPGERRSVAGALLHRLTGRWRASSKALAAVPPAAPAADERPVRRPLAWMPLMAYQPYWQDMLAFALPSFYDGRIRVNLKGREAGGRVEPRDYAATLDRIARLLGECVDPISGRGVVRNIECAAPADAQGLDETQADMVILWDNAPLGLRHPELGTIGPVPYRRTGGHTGTSGFAWFAGAGLAPADCGVTSAYDVVPSIIALLGGNAAVALSGTAVVRPVD